MDKKYQGWSILEREREYVRLKQEYELRHGFVSEQDYHEFIAKISKALDL